MTPAAPGANPDAWSKENNSLKVHDSVVVVTGASAGIGWATAERLAAAGANVVVTARRAERLQTLVASLAAYPGKQLALAGDIGRESFAHELIAHTVATFGRIDVLVNNAGVGHKGPLSTLPAADMRTLLDTNVLGLLYATQAAVIRMKEQRRGQIINISSIVGQRPLPDSTLYCASKTAVNFISRGLRMELRPHNITVTTVYPGLTDTEFATARLGGRAGNRFGLRGVSPERVGQAIVRAIARNRTEVFVTWYDWLFVHLNRLFPRTLDALFARATKWS